MRLSSIRIENYKGLREVEIPLSPFVCLIGENSVGKSSMLQALSLFFSGTSVAKSHYFDEARDIRIEVLLTEITDEDLGRLVPEHRERIRDVISANTLRLVRIYGNDGKGALKYRKPCPTDHRFSDEALDAAVKGKKGRALVDSVTAIFPELNDVLTPAMNQSEMRIAVQRLADNLPPEQKAMADVELPTGIEKSIYSIFPERIYIPAVKDFRDDVKTAESTPFGKILAILLQAIEPELADERALFEQLNTKLNRIEGDDRDQRLDALKTIEATVETFVKESFRNVTLRIAIPPPELKTVLSSATIFANDGVDGPIDSKGDGLRRAIVFAIIRSYVELQKGGLIRAREQNARNDTPYLLLFEEPELYLHPKAQEQLFEALHVFSQRHQVVVSTHSPLFFGPHATTTFVKMRKRRDARIGPKPFGEAHHVNLAGATERDQFQIICFENNNIAFFADTVVLVEGDSDYIVFPHLAKVIDPAWDCRQQGIAFARISGKGSIQRYRDFFTRFHMRVLVIADLDFLAGPEFSQNVASADARRQRDDLVRAIDAALAAQNAEEAVAQVLAAEQNARVREKWRHAAQIAAQHRRALATAEDAEAAMQNAEATQQEWARKQMLARNSDPQVIREKNRLLQMLRASGIYVLEKGAIEDYYPPGRITGNGKPARAQCFCNAITSREAALALCNGGHTAADGTLVTEFEAIFQGIFDGAE